MNTLSYRGFKVDIDFDYATKKHRIIFNKEGNKYIFDCIAFYADSTISRFVLKALYAVNDSIGAVITPQTLIELGVLEEEFNKLYDLEVTRENNTVPYNISSFKRTLNGVLEVLTSGTNHPKLPTFFAEFPVDKVACFQITDGSFYQPPVFDLSNTAAGEVTVTVVDIEGTPEFSKDDVTWQASNIFSGLPAGEHTIYVRSKTNLVKKSKIITVE